MRFINKQENICMYCGKKTKSLNPNILCEECQIDFGHTYYSEL